MIIQSTKVWVNEKFIPAQVEIERGKILSISEYNNFSCDIDYKNHMIIPGLIDIHCHGYKGMSLNYANKEGLDIWRKDLPKEGVTSFVATTWTAPEKDLLNSFKVISQQMNEDIGANILGIYVEGPQVSFKYMGVHNPYMIQKPEIKQFQRYQQAADNNIKMICIAPEMDDNHELIKHCAANNVVVSIGHTDADYQECLDSGKDGATCFTHTFNAMKGMHHRKPGVAGAAMSMDDMYTELICDNVHVSFPVCKILARVKGKDKLILVTDSVRTKGLKPGIYNFENRDMIVGEDGYGRSKNGNLAGSPNVLLECLKNLVVNCEAPIATAINAATINPANLLNIKNKGLIKKGYDADILIIDNDYKPIQTYVGGYKNEMTKMTY
jgi:N-acetylglucosamine-6-phosphate deacetylase